MKTYRYEAIDSKDNRSEGTITCSTFEKAVEYVVTSGRIPIHIEEINQAALIMHNRLNKLKSLKEKLEGTNVPREQKLNPVRVYIDPNYVVLFLLLAVWVGAISWWLLNKFV